MITFLIIYSTVLILIIVYSDKIMKFLQNRKTISIPKVMRRAILRGHKIKEKNGFYFFKDTGEPTATAWKDRPCGYCGSHNTPEGHDACLGELPGVMNACCGHGDKKQSYIQFENGVIVRGFKKFNHEKTKRKSRNPAIT